MCKRNIVFVVILSVFLAACHHENPLGKKKKEVAAHLLLTTAVNAELNLGIVRHAYQAGYFYWSCMEGKKSKSACIPVFKKMYLYLRKRDPGLELSDVSDKKLWLMLKAEYQRDAFNRIPE